MQILKIKLTNFRNYSNQTFNFSPTKNIIIGNNGVGKTNIVEGIYFLALTKSFRINEDQILIKDNEEYAVIEGEINNKINNKYKIVIDEKTKRVFIDNNQIKKLSDYLSKINIIIFNPEDLKLIKDSPSIHRKLINMEISQLDNEYLKNLSIYNKLLKQRNTYLKSMSLNPDISKEYLYILTDKLIDYGLKIYNCRKDFVKEINLYLLDIFKKITKKEKLCLKYVSDYENLDKIQLLKKYQNIQKKDISYGKTNYGIHLDDFIFYYNDYLSKNYLSEGEQKNAVIAFKLAEINVFYNKNKTMPILILDDLFSELDNEKIKKIIKFLKKGIQIFITTTDLKNIDLKILNNSKVFNLKNGKIEEKIYE